MSRGTPESSQIIWLENRVAELEEENNRLLLAYRVMRGTVQSLGASAHECRDSASRALKIFPLDPTQEQTQ